MKKETIVVKTEPLENNDNNSCANHQTRPVIRQTRSYVSAELMEDLIDREDDPDYADDSTDEEEKPKRKRGRPKKNIDVICAICRTSKTPEWRVGIIFDGEKEVEALLCNACGLRCSKLKKEKEDPSPKKPRKPRVKKTPKPKKQLKPGQKRLGRPPKPKTKHEPCPYVIKGKICGAIETPEWRKCTINAVEYTVCNRCGLHNTKMLQKELESKRKNSIYNLINPNNE